MSFQSPNGLSVNPGSVSGPSLVQGNVSTGQGTATVTIRGGGSAPIVPTKSAGLQAHPTVQGSPPVPQLSSSGTGARANPTTTITSGGSGPNLGSGIRTAPLPSGVQPNVVDLGTRTGRGVTSPSSSGLAKAAPLAGVGAASSGGVGLTTSVGAAGAGPVAGVIGAGLAIGIPAGEGLRRAGLAAEEAGLIPDTPIFEPYPEGWWGRQPNENPSPVSITLPGVPPFTGGQDPTAKYGIRYRTRYVINGRVITSPQRDLDNRDKGYSGPIRLGGNPPDQRPSLGFYYGPNNSYLTAISTFGNQEQVFDIEPYRLDGQPDTGGDPAAEPEVKLGVAPGSIPTHKPALGGLPNGTPTISPGPSAFPGSGLSPAPQPQLQPSSSPAAETSPTPAGTPSSPPQLFLPPSPRLQGGGGLTGPTGSGSTTTTGSGSTTTTIRRTSNGTTSITSTGTSTTPSNSTGTVSPPGGQPTLSTSSQLNSEPEERGETPSQPGGCNSGCSAGLTAGLNAANEKLDNLCNQKPDEPEEPEEGECTLEEVCEKLEDIAKAIGVKDFPLKHPLLTGESAGGQSNLVELIEWVTKCIDATNGNWPLDVRVLKADGNAKTVKLKDQADAFSELFGLSFTIAEDADAAVNIAARGVVETIQTKVATVQSGHWLRAISKFLGFNTRAKKDKIKISVSPKASGANNKLENQEMADFLKPSEQLFESVEYADSKELLIMLERILEDAEISRAALYKPLKQSKRGESNLTGEGIRREGGLSVQDLYAEEWEKVLDSFRKRGIEFDEKPGGQVE